MKKIDTLVKDMEDTILGLKGWDHIVGLKMGDSIAKTAFQKAKADYISKRRQALR